MNSVRLILTTSLLQPWKHTSTRGVPVELIELAFVVEKAIKLINAIYELSLSGNFFS